jgi:hypothetical protein
MTDDTDEPTHRTRVTDADERPTIRETFASLLGHDEPARAATAGEIGEITRTDEFYIPFDEHVEVYVTHADTEYRVVERDGELVLERTEGDE